MRRVWTWLGWGAAVTAIWLVLLHLGLAEEQHGVIQAVSRPSLSNSMTSSLAVFLEHLWNMLFE
jgi:hypothetical protein